MKYCFVVRRSRKDIIKKAEATAAAIDPDGWFHTGDAGYFKNGQLFLTERIKDLFKTSNGKYIAPQALETKLVIDRYIDQIAIIADQRKFVSALIVPVYGYVKEYAKEKGIEYKDMAELLQHPKIVGLFPCPDRNVATAVCSLRANQALHSASRTIQHGTWRTDQHAEIETGGCSAEL